MTYDICSETEMEIFGLIMGDDNEYNFFPAWFLFYMTIPEKSKHSSSITEFLAKNIITLRGFPITKEIYDRIMCYSLAKDFDKCLNK